MCFSIFIYNIALQNTDFGVLQKSSKHFLIYIFWFTFSDLHFLSTIFFPPFSFRTPKEMRTYFLTSWHTFNVILLTLWHIYCIFWCHDIPFDVMAYPLTLQCTFFISRRGEGLGREILQPPSERPSVCLSVMFSFRSVTRKCIAVFSRNFACTCTKSWGCAV